MVTVSLDWADSTGIDLAGYNVYRSTTSGGPYAKVNGSLLSSSDFTDSGVTHGQTYYYTVTAVDKQGSESPPSVEVSATP